MEPNGYQFPQIVISSGERLVLPDGNAFGVVLSGERQVWSDGGRSQQTAPETKHKVNCSKKIVSSLQDYPTDPRRYLKMI